MEYVDKFSKWMYGPTMEQRVKKAGRPLVRATREAQVNIEILTKQLNNSKRLAKQYATKGDRESARRECETAAKIQRRIESKKGMLNRTADIKDMLDESINQKNEVAATMSALSLTTALNRAQNPMRLAAVANGVNMNKEVMNDKQEILEDMLEDSSETSTSSVADEMFKMIEDEVANETGNNMPRPPNDPEPSFSGQGLPGVRKTKN